MLKRLWLCVLFAYSTLLIAQTYDGGIRIAWNFRERSFVGGGVYSRLKLLSDGTLACVYSAGRGVLFRTKRTDGWSQPVLVAIDADRQYDYTNAELTELADGRLIYAWNARPLSGSNQPYKIMVAYSSDRGRTWQGEQTLFVAGTDFEEGCWEPVVMQLPSGEIQLFFANEYLVPDKQQHIALLRSVDNGRTWSAPEVVCFREKHRDGMPVPVYLKGDKGIALAIEDNGFNGAFKPVIIHTSAKDNWKSGTVLSESSKRWGALAESDTLPAAVYAGAPYLIQLQTGETLLSFQSGEGRNAKGRLDHSLMQVYVGDSSARHFCGKSTPFPFPFNEKANTLWCALEQTDSQTVMATASISGQKGKNGVWTSTGRIYRPSEIPCSEGLTPEWSKVPEQMFIGAETQAQARIYSAWDKDSLYFRICVADMHIVEGTSQPSLADVDAVEICLNRNKTKERKPEAGIYKLLISSGGRKIFLRRKKDLWQQWESKGCANILPSAEGYTVTLSVPWKTIQGRPGKEGIGLFFRLHNNDGDGVVSHESMSGAVEDNPQTWIRCMLGRCK